MAETLLNQQEPKVGQSTANTPQRPDSHFKRIVGTVLSVVMLVLTAYVLHLQYQNNMILAASTQMALDSSERATENYRTYEGKYKETKIELDETTRKLVAVNLQLNQVTAELNMTKGLLTQTQGMLLQAQEDNANLKQQLQGLENIRSTENVQNASQLEAKIQSLKDRDTEVSGQLSDLKNQLHAYEGDFSNIQEGKSLIILFRDKIRLVKTRMHYLNQEANYARIAAQKEKDRLAILNGNSGFIVRDGQVQNPDGTKKTFAIDVKIDQ